MKRCLNSMIVLIKYPILFFIVNMLFLQAASAQPLYTERLFLAPEKENGVAGDTLWVEGQLRAADSSFSPLSRYVYLECINAQDSLPQNIAERRQKELQDMAQKVQEYAQFADQDLSQLQKKLMEPIILKVNNAVKAVGDAEGMTYIFGHASALSFFVRLILLA